MAPDNRRYVLNYIKKLDKVFADLEIAKNTIAKEKSQFCQLDIKILRYICDVDDRHPDNSKMLKILN